MGKGFWLGALAGLVVALAVAIALILVFEIHSPWSAFVGFACGTVFTNIGIAVGTSLDDGY